MVLPIIIAIIALFVGFGVWLNLSVQRRQRPNVRINFVRSWVTACPQCGNEARFHFQTLRLNNLNHDAPVATETSGRSDR